MKAVPGETRSYAHKFCVYPISNPTSPRSASPIALVSSAPSSALVPAASLSSKNTPTRNGILEPKQKIKVLIILNLLFIWVVCLFYLSICLSLSNIRQTDPAQFYIVAKRHPLILNFSFFSHKRFISFVHKLIPKGSK